VRGGVLIVKLYKYEEERKLNQALGSFKRNGVPIIEVQALAIGSKVIYCVLTDPKYEPRPKEPKKVEKKVEKKVKTKKEQVKK